MAIVSDAVHDMLTRQALTSLFLEKKSKKQPDETYTYGYARYSVLGSVITTVILLFGSAIVIYTAIQRIFNPVEINYNEMIVFAVVGVVLNFLAAYVTREGDSMNQKAVNLHMLEDVLGWIVVLIGAVVMRSPIFDPSCPLVWPVHSGQFRENLKKFWICFEASRTGLRRKNQHISEIEGCRECSYITSSMGGQCNYATMHIVTDEDIHHQEMFVRICRTWNRPHNSGIGERLRNV